MPAIRNSDAHYVRVLNSSAELDRQPVKIVARRTDLAVPKQESQSVACPEAKKNGLKFGENPKLYLDCQSAAATCGGLEGSDFPDFRIPSWARAPEFAHCASAELTSGGVIGYFFMCRKKAAPMTIQEAG